ncbi:unknown protein [Seminavis robusta]|uniref:Uncharacterized protein n=1 Tax=Seminavis robusta TaxID=568900 RepID=A0A9N8F4N8_9STRA|nr:unknown protein [Seminavis robusta]|eukprot:Sro3756_g350830.1 n/a (118) ;mRNA; r:1767-2120
MKSWIQLYAIASGASLEDKDFQSFMRQSYEHYSNPMLAAVRNLEASKSNAILAVDFHDLVHDAVPTFQKILAHLSLEADIATCQKCVQIHEVKHVNDDIAASIVEFQTNAKDGKKSD